MEDQHRENDEFCQNIQNNNEEENFLDCMSDLAEDLKEYRLTKRPECLRCRRPATVCWCPFLPKEPIQIATTVFILQHPFEELRKLKTAPMLAQSLEAGKCHIIRGKRFGGSKRNIKYPQFADVLEAPNTLLLFPGDDAVNVTELPPLDTPYNIVVLDGTWTQARSMYAHNRALQIPKKVMINCDRRSRYVVRTQPTDTSVSTLECVMINCDRRSRYVVRTQPTDTSVSTLECVATALSVLERRPELEEILTAPLVALCNYQLDHGAVQHESREYKIAHGLWTKKLPVKLIRRMERERQAAEQGTKEGHS